MIFIDYPGTQKPDAAWLEKAEALTARLKAAPDKAARDAIIDNYNHMWSEIKEWLGTFSDDKCWFSEARDTASYWHVDHFRPKKAAKTAAQEGYWWLAFNYLNYRLCGAVGNSKKGSHFPLRPGCPQAKRVGDCADEDYLLIDPTCKSDVNLLTFAEGGRAVPATDDDWERKRATLSIERYNLNGFPALSRARETIWNLCKAYVAELEMLYHEAKEAQDAGEPASTSCRKRINDTTTRLTRLTCRSAPFSAVARAYVQHDHRSWVRRCLY